MFYSRQELKSKAQEYCKQNRIELAENLGFGLQGVVFATSRQSAIKVHADKTAYLRELAVYQRLAEYNLQQIHELIIPTLLGFDDNSFIIEMSLVAPPFIVDFGGAYLDAAPAHATDEQIRKDWLVQKKEQFGKNWLEVLTILSKFEELYEIYIVDVNPGNIQFMK